MYAIVNKRKTKHLEKTEASFTRKIAAEKNKMKYFYVIQTFFVDVEDIKLRG